MDESCGHLHQVDESHYAADHGCRPPPLIRNLKETNDGGNDFSSPVAPINRAGMSLIVIPLMVDMMVVYNGVYKYLVKVILSVRLDTSKRS
jgi:hypothetical protein